MKIGDSVYCFGKDLEIVEEKVVKVGRLYYYIESKNLHKEYSKININTNKSVDSFRPLEFFTCIEDIQNSKKDIILRNEINRCFIDINKYRNEKTFNTSTVLELLKKIILEVEKK